MLGPVLYSRFFCSGAESSNYGIFGSIPPLGSPVPTSLHSKTLNVVDSGRLWQLNNIYPLIIRMGKQATLSSRTYCNIHVRCSL